VSKYSLHFGWVIGFVSVFSAAFLPAQTSLLERLGAAEGLSQGMIFDLLQDRQGFLWFATKDGLNRYDGYSFQVFQNNPFDPFSISDNEVLTLLEDHLGRIWAGTANNGLAVLDPASGRFYCLNKLASQSINSIAQTPDGSIWVGTAVGVNRVRVPDVLPSNTPHLEEFASIDTFTWDVVDNRLSAPPNNTVDLLGTGDGKLWVSTFRQIGVFDPATGRFQNRWTNKDPENADYITSYFKESPDGSIWVGQPARLLRFHDEKMDVFPLPERSVFPYTDLAFDASGDLFVSTRKQIFKLPAAQAATAANASLELFYRFPDDGIIGSTKLLMDRGGLLWIGTNGYGLRKYNPGNPRFYQYFEGKSPRRILSDAQGRVWVWLSGGVFQRLHEHQQPASGPLFSDNKLLQHDCIQARDGVLWLLCENKQSKQKGILIRLNAQSLDEEARFSIPIDVGMFSRLYEDKTGMLWILGCSTELTKFDPAKPHFDQYDFSETTGFHEASLSVLMDDAGHLWIGTPHGLVRAIPNAQGLKFILHKNNPDDHQTLNCNSVLALLNDPLQPQRYLWIGTKGGGLNRLDKHKGTFQQYTTAEGLPNNVVYSILPDSEGDLWLSTNYGLCKFNLKTGVFQIFFDVDGLQDNEFNTLSFAAAADGRLYFGGVNGVTAFYPSELNASAQSPPVLITLLKINGLPVGRNSDVLRNSIKQAQTIELNYQQNQLTFEFAAMDFSAPRMNQFRYRLLGIDKNFGEPTTTNSAAFAHLSPGEYTFEVLTGGSRGIWGGSPARLSIRILPPWWRSGWAYSFYFLIFALSAWSFYRFQMKKALLENKLQFEHREAIRLAELDRLKTNFFSSVTHEFRTPLTLLLEPARQLLAEAKGHAQRYRLELIENNARRLLQFVNQLLDLSKLEAGQMPLDLRPGNPANTVRAVAEQFQPLALQHSIRLNVELRDSATLVVFDEIKWEQVVSNLLSNALKFTNNGGAISLILTEEKSKTDSQKQYKLEVADTGTGISSEDLPFVFDRFFQTDHVRGGTGIGLSLSKELLERMGGNISVKSPGSEGIGTIFTVYLPCELAKVQQQHPDEQALSPATANYQEPAPGKPNLASSCHELQDANYGSSPLLLLIEDDTELRQFLRASLPPSYRIVEASDGAEGIQMALELVPDLVISDLVMPLKNGFEVAETLKGNSTTSHIPLLLLTAKSAIESKIQGLQRGADVYLTKPFRADELVAQIENLLTSRQRLQEYFSQAAQNQTVAESAVAAFSAQENEFLQRLIQVVEQNLDNEAMDADGFARAVFISRSQLHRKISALTGLSLTEFVRNHRLDRAKDMLLHREGSISEIAWRTGFPNAKYFSTCFKERFGVTPSGMVAGQN